MNIKLTNLWDGTRVEFRNCKLDYEDKFVTKYKWGSHATIVVNRYCMTRGTVYEGNTEYPFDVDTLQVEA